MRQAESSAARRLARAPPCIAGMSQREPSSDGRRAQPDRQRPPGRQKHNRLMGECAQRMRAYRLDTITCGAIFYTSTGSTEVILLSLRGGPTGEIPVAKPLTTLGKKPWRALRESNPPFQRERLTS